MYPSLHRMPCWLFLCFSPSLPLILLVLYSCSILCTIVVAPMKQMLFHLFNTKWVWEKKWNRKVIKRIVLLSICSAVIYNHAQIKSNAVVHEPRQNHVNYRTHWQILRTFILLIRGGNLCSHVRFMSYQRLLTIQISSIRIRLK